MEHPSDNKPTYIAYLVQDIDDDGVKGRWTEIGAAWPHHDGKGLAISLHAVPLNGRVVLREPSEKPYIEA